MREFLIIHGPTVGVGKSPADYVGALVYGTPEIHAVDLGEKFVAICEWDDVQSENGLGGHTFARMASFGGIGASYLCTDGPDRSEPIAQYGSWIFLYSETITPEGFNHA